MQAYQINFYVHKLRLATTPLIRNYHTQYAFLYAECVMNGLHYL